MADTTGSTGASTTDTTSTPSTTPGSTVTKGAQTYTPQSLSAQHLSTGYEVQRTNNFEISITGLGTDFTMNVISFPLPKYQISPLELSHGNSKVRVANQIEMSTGDVMVRDIIAADMEDILYGWYKTVYDPETGKIGWAQDYKKVAYVYEYAPDGTNTRVWELKGLWPTSIDFGDLSNESPDKKTMTMTLSYDNAYPLNRKTNSPKETIS